jgi:hypothetical protein
MKLAPITTARLAVFAWAMMARLSASVRSVWTWLCPGAGNVELHRFGAGRQQQLVESKLAAVAECQLFAFGIEPDDLGLELEIDLVLGVPAVLAQRHPVFRRRAGEIVLRQIGPIDGRGRVIAQHGDGAGVTAPPQHLGAGKAGCAAADDDDAFARRSGRLWRGPILLSADKNLAAAFLDLPARQRTERGRRERFAGRQIETSMMPGAADGVADHQSFGERPVIMRALGGNRRHLAAVAHQHHLVAADVARQHLAFGKIGGGNTLGKIGSARLLVVLRHYFPPAAVPCH